VTRDSQTVSRRNPLLGLALAAVVVLVLFPEVRHMVVDSIVFLIGACVGVFIGAVMLLGGRRRR
jgi:hypothetical protein